MPAPNILSGRMASTEWFASGGLPDVEPSNATAYALRLVRYISDASTVRTRVLERYSSAPSIENIRRWRQDWTDLVTSRAALRAVDFDEEAEDAEDHDFARSLGHLASSVMERSASLAGYVVPAAEHPAAANDRPKRKDSGPAITVRDVIERCGAPFKVTVDEIIGISRKRHIVRARQFAATVLRARKNSYPQVARYLGGRDHSTIIHSVRAFFDVGMRDQAYVNAWMSTAPCVLKMARSAEELDVLMGVNG